MSQSILGGWRAPLGSDFDTHSVGVAGDQPVCIACMALLPRFVSARGFVGWPVDYSCDCTMSIVAPGGARVCRNCLTLNSSEHHVNRGTVENPIPCVPVPPEYANKAQQLRVLARAVELSEKWDCPNVVVVEHKDNRTMIYGNLFNQIGGQGIREFVRSQSQLPDVERACKMTRNEVEMAYIMAHDLYRGSRLPPHPISDESIPALATQSATKLGQDLAIFTSTLNDHSRVIQCVVPKGGNMPQDATFNAQPLATPFDNENSETTNDGGYISRSKEDENMSEGEEDDNTNEGVEGESMSGVEMIHDESDGSEYQDSADCSREDEESMDIDDEDSSDSEGSEEDEED